MVRLYPSAWIFRAWLVVSMLGGACLQPAQAQDAIPFGRLQVDLNASNEPLNALLSRLLAQGGVPSTMTSAVASGRVNGRLRGSLSQVFHELAQTYGFTWFYNGSVLHICGLGEMESRLLQVAPGDVDRVGRALDEMRLNDRRFTLRISRSEGQVLVSGPPPYVELVGEVVNRIAGTPSRRPLDFDTRVFRLRHARAADTVVTMAGMQTMVPGIARILNEAVGGVRDSGQAAQRSLPVTVPGLRGKGQIAIGKQAGNALTDANGNNSGAYVTAAVTEGARPRAASDAAAEAVPSPMPATDTSIRADPRLNAVIIRDLPSRMDMYARLIQQLDVSSPLVEIEATVIDVSQDKSEQLGIDWRLHGSRVDVVSSPNGLATNGSTSSTSANVAGGLLFQVPALSAGTGLVGTVLFGNDRNNFVARLNALAQKGDANLVSKPRVLTLDNTEAVLQSTQDFYVRVAGRDQVDLFNVSLGLVLRVTPSLMQESDGSLRVRLNVHIEDGNTQSGGQVDQIPVVQRNAIATETIVGDGQTLLIGGYTIDEKTRRDSGVPVLSQVPGLKWLFGQRESTARSMERMFMITPKVHPAVALRAALPATDTPP